MCDDVHGSIFLLPPSISLISVLSFSLLKSFHWGSGIGARQNRKRHHTQRVAQLQCALREIPEGGRDYNVRTQIGQHLFRLTRIPTRTEPAVLVVFASQITKDRGWEGIASLHFKTCATNRFAIAKDDDLPIGFADHDAHRSGDRAFRMPPEIKA